MKYFVTGVDTDSGKTLSSAILCEALKADYWKPVQAGLPKDSETVKKLVSNPTTFIHPERFILKTPMSPHAAARIDGISIHLNDFKLPAAEDLIVEGAGGCMVPLNEKDLIVDLIQIFQLPVIIVADLYLGSINHTLLTIEALQRRSVQIKGIIFNGPEAPDSMRFILNYSQLKCLLHIQPEAEIDKSIVGKYAAKIKENL